MFKSHQTARIGLHQPSQLPHKAHAITRDDMVQHIGQNNQTKFAIGDCPKIVEEGRARTAVARNPYAICGRVEPTHLGESSAQALSQPADTTAIIQNWLVKEWTNESLDAIRFIFGEIARLLARSDNAIGVQRFVILCICVKFGRHLL